MPAQTFGEFEKELNKFGNNVKKAFKREIDDATKNGKTVTQDNLRDIILNVANNPKHMKGLQLVANALTGYHNPRADDPRATQNLDVANKNQNSNAQLKMPNWAAGFDGLQLPDTITPKNKQNVLTQFNNEMDKNINKFKNELRLRNKPKMAPMPGKKAPRPER